MFQRFEDAARRAAAAISSKPPGTRWFLACDTDADGVCSAAVISAALRRLGHRFTVRASRDKTEAGYRELAAVDTDGYILLDKGTSHLETLGQIASATSRPVIVVDHHNVSASVPPGVVLLNPRAEGLDGSRDASSSTTAVALARALHGDKALVWAPVGLSGAIGDWQHIPEWKGYNLHLLEVARAAGHVKTVAQPHFIGFDLPDALSTTWNPIPGLTGDRAAAELFLQNLGLPLNAEIEDLTAEESARLVSACTLRLLEAGQGNGTLERLVEQADHDARLGTSLRHVFRIVDACGRLGQAGTGLAFLMGDKAAAAEAEGLFATYKRSLATGITRLRSEGTRVLRALQVARTDDPDLTGMVAGLGMTHVVKDTTRPLCVVAVRPDGDLQISTRALEEHVKAGLDLGRACSEAARAVGAEGGGHPIAAGAVIPAAQEAAFLEKLDAELVRQGFRKA